MSMKKEGIQTRKRRPKNSGSHSQGSPGTSQALMPNRNSKYKHWEKKIEFRLLYDVMIIC